MNGIIYCNKIQNENLQEKGMEMIKPSVDFLLFYIGVPKNLWRFCLVIFDMLVFFRRRKCQMRFWKNGCTPELTERNTCFNS